MIASAKAGYILRNESIKMAKTETLPAMNPLHTICYMIDMSRADYDPKQGKRKFTPIERVNRNLVGDMVRRGKAEVREYSNVDCYQKDADGILTERMDTFRQEWWRPIKLQRED